MQYFALLDGDSNSIPQIWQVCLYIRSPLDRLLQLFYHISGGYVKYNQKYSEAALGKSYKLLRIAEIQKLLKVILDNRDIA